MSYSVEFLPAARRNLEQIPLRDRARISKAIDRLGIDPFPSSRKKLEGTEYWRIRAGNYRIVYTIQESELVILIIRIGHRGEVYRRL